MKILYKNNLSKLLVASIILLPILNSSHIGNLNLGYGDITLAILFLLGILPQIWKSTLKIEAKKFWIFLLYLGIVSIVNCCVISTYSFESMFIPYIKYIFYALIIFGSIKYCDVKYGINFYINVCTVESIYLFIQYILTVTIGINLPYVFPYVNMEYGIYGSTYNSQLLQTLKYEGIRGVGFFPEPSHFAEYTIFAIILILFKKEKNKRDNIKCVLILLGIILTKSTIGILALLIVFYCYYLKNVKKINKKRFLNRIVWSGVGVILVCIIANKLDVIKFIISRLETITERTWAVSGNLRLLRGFLVYREAPTLIKIFGIGCGNYLNFINAFGIQTFFDRVMNSANEYMNGASAILLRSGIIGSFLYLIFALDFFRRSNTVKRIIFIIGLEILFTENFFFSPIYVMHMCLLQMRLEENEYI